MALLRNHTEDSERPAKDGGGASRLQDHELWKRVRQGDERAFEQVVERYGPELFRVAYSLVGNAADAEDVVQEALAGAIKGAAGFRGDASIRTWLTQILVRQAYRLRRSRKPALSIHAVEEEVEVKGGESAVESRIDVMAALEKLTPEHRDVVVLREIEGLSYEEMAAALQVPRGTVESRLHRARMELRKVLGEDTE
jgi:RNA polymerase sigma-70 factor (ECF subfamily)